MQIRRIDGFDDVVFLCKQIFPKAAFLNVLPLNMITALHTMTVKGLFVFVLPSFPSVIPFRLRWRFIREPHDLQALPSITFASD